MTGSSCDEGTWLGDGGRECAIMENLDEGWSDGTDST